MLSYKGFGRYSTRGPKLLYLLYLKVFMLRGNNKIIIRFQYLLILFIIGISESSLAQSTQDSVFFLANKKGIIGKIGKSVSINNNEFTVPLNGALKTADDFEPYKGNIIKEIRIVKPGFNKTVSDTLLKKNFISTLGDKLHTKTKEQIIRNNLFFDVGDSLYPNLLADNEKFLRDLSFVQDARIKVQDPDLLGDSVVVIVYVKDVFPFGGSVSEASTDLVKFEVNDDNLLGSGNRIQIQQLLDSKREPTYGLGIEYLQRNIAGTFINLTVGYQNQNPAFNTGYREEKALYIRTELPLVSPYHIFTGGLEVGQFYTANFYDTDSAYNTSQKYNYRIADAWIGYNIGARKQLTLNFTSRKKKIISLRLIKRNFLDIPDINKRVYDSRYTDITGVISSFTIFKQDFYRTNFIYGFGRNEDIPIGYNLSFTGGWADRNNISRPYIGTDFQRNFLTKNKGYINMLIRGGGYYNNNSIEDLAVLASVDFFTKLRQLGGSTWYNRHFMNMSIAHQFNTNLNDPLFLSSIYGLPNVNNTGTFASSRYTFNEECVFYNTWKLVGFRFAPFVFANISFLNSGKSIFLNSDGYAAIGTGVRTRNENLIFGTIELKTYYYPRIVGVMSHWNITINSDIRFRYVTQLIRKPDFVQIN